MPTEIAREKQQQLADQLLAAEGSLERLTAASDSQEATLEALVSLLDSCGQAYARSDDKGRRDYNHAWFEGLDIDVDDEQTVAEEQENRRTRGPAVLMASNLSMFRTMHVWWS